MIKRAVHTATATAKAGLSPRLYIHVDAMYQSCTFTPGPIVGAIVTERM